MGTDSESAYEIIQGEVVVEGDISLGPVSDALERHAYLIRNPAHIEAPRDKALIDGRNRRRWNTTVIEVKIEDDSALDNFTAAEVDEIRKVNPLPSA